MAFGCLGLARGDLGAVASGVGGAANLMGAWRDASARHSLESKALLDNVRADVLKTYEAWLFDHRSAQAELVVADDLLARHLVDCVPDLRAIAALTSGGALEDDLGTLIVTRLAERHPLFRPPGEAGAGEVAREFALLTITAAVRSSLNDADYRDRLLPHIVEAMAVELAGVGRSVTQILDGILQSRADLRTLLDQVPDLALRREVIQLVGSNPAATVTELAGDVARFAREYQSLLGELASLRADDNQLRGAEEAAQAALLEGDLSRARQLLGEATRLAGERAVGPIRELARLLDRQARMALLDRDWVSARDAWTQSATLIGPIDAPIALYTASQAAIALDVFGERFGQLAAMRASRDIWQALVDQHDRAGSHEVAGCWMGLGNSLQRYGRRVSHDEGLAVLDQAISAYSRAIELYEAHDDPEATASARISMGGAYYSRGVQTGGAEYTTYFDLARDTYTRALEYYSQETSREDWSSLQSALGMVNRRQGERTGGHAGAVLIRKAIAHQRAALGDDGREAEGPDARALRNALVVSLYSLGELVADNDSVAAVAEAIELTERDLARTSPVEFPHAWAHLNFNLSGALRVRAKNTDPAERFAILLRAQDALEDAAKIWSAENYPGYHQTILENLAALNAEKRASGGNTP